ncbi:carbohydrate-binding protein [Alkaliflexus imshenetskii]|uniref:carbohydrate-binding protein n=1 Tax=Alkaliflexus imshenetskii TaxID=286730 RepID=UPI0004797133|nr:carbohydrate-binding protein [Alkaliflexus imshenetskii]
MKKLLTFIIIFMAVNSLLAQQISPYLIGNNVWLPPWMSGSKWNALKSEMGEAGFQLIRIGGNGAQNATAYTNARIADLVVEIRALGAEPIVQVPYTHTAQQAIDMITYINGTRALNVKYWAIGNEPNHQPLVPVTTVATYTRRIASALKAYDPNIKTMGPTTAWYDTSYFNPLFVNKGADDISGTDANGNYYIDVLTWNKYAITYGLEYNGTITSAVNLVNSQNNTRPAGKKMEWAILEFNGHYNNTTATDAQKCWSFNTGQTFAEVYDIGMRRGAVTIAGWSIYEGGGNRSQGDLGLFDGLDELFGGANRGRSSFYHSYMLGRHMKANYLPNAHNGPVPNGANNGITIVSMGDVDGFSVMIINRSATAAYDFNIGLNNAYGASAPLRIRVAAGISKEITGHIAAKTTKMLVFNAQGDIVLAYEYNEKHSKNFCGPVITEYSSATALNGTLTFVTPQDGDRLKTSQKLTITVAAEHASGIESVDMYINDEFIGKITQAPYTWDYTNELLNDLEAGFYDLKAVSHINGGSTITKTISVANAFSFAPVDPMPVPGKIEAEFFDDMNGIRWQDTQDDGGGLNIGWIDTGDWLEYIVDVAESGVYEVNFRVSGWTDTGKIALRNVDNVNLATAQIPNRGAQQYQSWFTVEGNTSFSLEAGVQTIRIVAEGSPFNFNWFEIVPFISNSVVDLGYGHKLIIHPIPFNDRLFVKGTEGFSSAQLYNQCGQMVWHVNGLSGDSLELVFPNLPSGVYILNLFNNVKIVTRKVVKL